MNCSYQLPREHRGLREELGITDVALGPELAIRTKEHSGRKSSVHLGVPGRLPVTSTPQRQN